MMDPSVYKLWKFAIFICLWRIGKAVPENCYQELFSYSGSITSLNYPQPYPSGRNCTWVISTITGFKLQLMFETFDVENHTSCNYDYVMVFDGITDQDKVMGKFCGQQVPLPLISSKNLIRIVFVSDARVEGSGFKATYNTVMCGQNFKQIVGILKSADFPENYMGYRKCIWTIETDKHLQVALAFSRLNVSSSSDCSSEYLEIYSLSDENNTLPLNAPDMLAPRSHLLTRICGNNATKQINDNIRSTSNKMYVLFVSEGPTQGMSFEASFTSDLDECAINNGGCQHVCKNSNGNFTCECHDGSSLNQDRHSCKQECYHTYFVDEEGSSLQTPNYPKKYPKNQVCGYFLHTSPSHRISLKFTDFWVERPWDFVTVHDGMTSESVLLGNFTGFPYIKPSLLSTGSYLYVVFKSDALNEHRGFSASYISSCKRELQASLSTGVIYSHMKYGQDKYNTGYRDCVWSIVSTNKSVIKLWFSEFELLYDGNCTEDYVEIYDATWNKYSSMGRFCGKKIPGPFFSNGAGLDLKFESKDRPLLSYKGFKAMYKIMV